MVARKTRTELERELARMREALERIASVAGDPMAGQCELWTCEETALAALGRPRK